MSGETTQDRASVPERLKATIARWAHATWPERPECFCRDNGCQLGYLALVNKTYDEHLREVAAERTEARLQAEALAEALASVLRDDATAADSLQGAIALRDYRESLEGVRHVG